MFGIFPTNVVIEENDELVLPASIVIDSFSESFNIPLAYWGGKIIEFIGLILLVKD